MIDLKTYNFRRERFLEALEGYAAIIPAASLVTHHADCEYPFRQNSDFWYLTGLDEPDAVALFLPFNNENEQDFEQPFCNSISKCVGYKNIGRCIFSYLTAVSQRLDVIVCGRKFINK